MKLVRKLLGQNGVSLMEILIALVITGVVTTALFKAYLTQHQSYVIQDDITQIQQSARAAIDELSRHIRMAGNELPVGLNAIQASNTDPDTITLTYRSDGCETTLASKMPQPSAELKCTGDVSCFYDGQWVYIFHPDSGGGEFFLITHVQAAALHIQHNTMSLSQAYDEDAIILSMEQVKFFIDDQTDPEHPSLMIDYPGLAAPAVFAENITDLQFQYRMKNGMVVDDPILAEDIREVMISVTGRSANPDYERDKDDQYRFRSYASSVNVRNLGS